MCSFVAPPGLQRCVSGTVSLYWWLVLATTAWWLWALPGLPSWMQQEGLQ